jgi:quercetin dioxygenase-like cupin family protein
MITKALIAAAASLLVLGLESLPVYAQGEKAAEPKGVTVSPLVASVGFPPFRATVNTPIAISGGTVDIAPGGQTGRQRFAVPTYLYVIQGVLTTEYEAGPDGTRGAQYHAAGQSFVDPGGIWHNHKNGSPQPVKYLIVHIGYPGAPTVQKPEAD